MATPDEVDHGMEFSSVVDPELLPGSGSGIIVPDPNPAKSESAYK